MRPITLATLAVTAVSVTAHPHRYAHEHLHRAVAKRAALPAVVYKPGPVATVVVYVLNGQPISEDEVRQGVANGTLVWGDDGNLSTSIAATPTPVTLPTPEPPQNQIPQQSVPAQITQAPEPPKEVASSSAKSDPQPSPAPEPPKSEPEPSTAPAPPKDQDSGTEGIGREFPNGEFSCENFPMGYGATPIDHAGLGGWIGIQDPGFSGAAGFDDIMTVPHGSCSDGTCCKPNSFCSYSCPPGYLKSSWPEKQGARKQSVGGLHCNAEGRLELASGAIAKTLCVKGTDKVKIMVQNKLSVSESICRTDYPGTESETVPITTQPGESAELACPDNSLYYRWDGKPTSAQYYINPKGTPEHEACTWGDGSKSVGNWAPVNLGVGFDAVSQKGYVSLFPNAPTNPDGKLEFTIELLADDISGKCKYSNGMYYYGDDYSESSPSKGCTIALNSGTLTVLLSD